jgi:hypothetical protein
VASEANGMQDHGLLSCLLAGLTREQLLSPAKRITHLLWSISRQ